jgi:hypothetical protein
MRRVDMCKSIILERREYEENTYRPHWQVVREILRSRHGYLDRWVPLGTAQAQAQAQDRHCCPVFTLPARALDSLHRLCS